MSSSALKIIALISMSADHVGYLFFPEYPLLRAIGRIAFPIYAFLISEGYRKTSDRKRYAVRLLIFAAISEMPFDLVFSDAPALAGKLLDFSRQNIFFTLAAGFFAIWSHDIFASRGQLKSAYLAGASCVSASFFLFSDYSIYGAALIYLMHVFREKPAATAASLVGVNALLSLGTMLSQGAGARGFYIQLFAIAALPLILSYNGKRGAGLKFFFYAYYPAHLLLLAFTASLLRVFTT